MNCKNCGQPLVPGAAFCGNCGIRIEQNLNQDHQPAPQLQAAAMPQPQLGASETPNNLPPGVTFRSAFDSQGQAVSDKSYIATFFLAEMLGMFGIDRFYLGEYVTGILKGITFGGFGIWALIDIILTLTGERKDKQGRPFPDRKEHLTLTIVVFIVMTLLVFFVVVYDITQAPNILNKDTLKNEGSSLNQGNSTNSSGNNSNLPLSTTFQTSNLGASLVLTDLNGHKLQVTMIKLYPMATPLDPTVDSPKSGDQLAAIQLNIKNLSDTKIDDSVDNSMVVYDKSGKSYYPSLNNVKECQPFNDGGYDIDSGQSATGCEVFEIPSSVNIAKIEFTPSSGQASDAGIWLTQQ